jgi:hypothetical protein
VQYAEIKQEVKLTHVYMRAALCSVKQKKQYPSYKYVIPVHLSQWPIKNVEQSAGSKVKRNEVVGGPYK